MKNKVFLFIFISILSLNNTYSDYQKNINDDIKIYKIDEKISNYIEKSKNPDITQKKIIKKIEKILGVEGKTEIYNKKDFKNFREYALIKIYKFLDYGDLFYNVKNNPSYAKVLENDLIKIIVTDNNFTLNNNELYWTRKDGLVFKYIKFHKINSKEKTIDFIKNNLIEKEYISKCIVYKDKNSIYSKGVLFGVNDKFFLKSSGYYIDNEYPGIEYCGENGTFYFERISENIVISVKKIQDYNGIDYSSIEIK